MASARVISTPRQTQTSCPHGTFPLLVAPGGQYAEGRPVLMPLQHPESSPTDDVPESIKIPFPCIWTSFI